MNMKQPLHQLAALIEQRKEANGWSDNSIAQRAVREGHQLTDKNISRINNNPVITLKAETMRALASGLDLPVMEVVRAALASMGFTTPQGRVTPEEAIQADPELSTEVKAMLLTQLRALRGDNVVPLRRVARRGKKDD